MCDGATRSRGAAAVPQPRWGRLYGLMFIAMATFGATELLTPSGLRTVLRCGLVLALFGVMALWVRRNRATFDVQNWCECAPTKTTMRVIPSRRRLPTIVLRPPAVAPLPEGEEPWMIPAGRGPHRERRHLRRTSSRGPG